jgi:hypothetical protein
VCLAVCHIERHFALFYGHLSIVLINRTTPVHLDYDISINGTTSDATIPELVYRMVLVCDKMVQDTGVQHSKSIHSNAECQE